jgi:hypothetical protein
VSRRPHEFVTAIAAVALGAALLTGAGASRAQELTPAAGSADAAAGMSLGEMSGFYGPYALTRESSGTSWQPDSTLMTGLHRMSGPWMSMVHGLINVIYDDQGGPRGATQTFSNSWLMFLARRELSDGAFGLRLMLSADPLMGRDGYPLLFQTGETANGVVPLIDRQHPHDLLMEAAVTYSFDPTPRSSLFVYAGLPGEPALGPPAFMHRLSGMDDPQAPLGHHWLDSTHVSWGVVTGGYTWRNFKVEASAFNGREPDQDHYNIETGPLDSWAVRLSLNPTADWSLQASTGHLLSPEQLQPGVNVQRTTASASYNAPVALSWQTTVAWGHNEPSTGQASNAFLIESELRLTPAHTLFARFERVGKDDLFLAGQALYGRLFVINSLTAGYVHDFADLGGVSFGVGALVSTYSYPSALNEAYGYRPTSFMVFMHARL